MGEGKFRNICTIASRRCAQAASNSTTGSTEKQGSYNFGSRKKKNGRKVSTEKENEGRSVALGRGGAL